MSITIHPELEARLRARAEAEGLTVEAYIERLVQTEQQEESELEALAFEGLNSGEPIEIEPGYWEEKHRRLETLLHEAEKSGDYIGASKEDFDAMEREAQDLVMERNERPNTT